MKNEDRLSIARFYKKAIPNIMASISIPLLGIANIAVIGNLNDANLIAGVTVGTQILDTIYWGFGNIRFVASGQSAQSMGTGNRKERLNALLQPLFLAVLIFLLLILFRDSIFFFFMSFIKPEAAVQTAAKQYFTILIAASFCVLADYIIRGWLLGQGKTILCMIIQIGCTLLNIALAVFFVVAMQKGVAGVAWATLISQTLAFLIEFIYLFLYGKFKKEDFDLEMLLDKRRIWIYMKLNLDFFLRTAFHIVVKNGFTAYSSSLGTATLAANGIINQVISIIIYALEALGNTATLYAGRYLGKKDKDGLKRLWYITIKSSLFMAFVLAGVFRIFIVDMLSVYTNAKDVLEVLSKNRNWIFICPLSACIMDVLTGFYSGCTYIKPIRNGAFFAMICFFISCYLMIPKLGNNGLWASQCIYWMVTAVIMMISYPFMLRRFQLNDNLDS